MGNLYKDYPGLVFRVESTLKEDDVYPSSEEGDTYLVKSVMLAKIYGRQPVEVFLQRLYKDCGFNADVDALMGKNFVVALMMDFLKRTDIEITIEEVGDLYRFIRDAANRV